MNIHLNGNGAFGQSACAHVGKDVQLKRLQLGAEDVDVLEFGSGGQPGNAVEVRAENGSAHVDAETVDVVKTVEELGYGRSRPGLYLEVFEMNQRVEGVAGDALQDGQRLNGQRLEAPQSGQTLSIQLPDGVGWQVELFEQRRRRPQEGRHLNEAVTRQVQDAEPVQADRVVDARVAAVVQGVGRQVEGDQMRERHVRPRRQSDAGQLQLLDALQVVEELFKVGPDRVEAQIQMDQAVQVREDVVRQQRQPVVRQLQRYQVRYRRHHHCVQMLHLQSITTLGLISNNTGACFHHETRSSPVQLL